MTEVSVDPDGDPEPGAFERIFRRRAFWILAIGGLYLLGHAFVPLEEFIHRGDDAYYYFKLAVNFPRYGFWTFDGIHPSNGVQPLWGMILTAAAMVMHWVGITDVDLMARVFVLLTAAIHLASCLLLFHLVERTVSLAAAIAAAGAALFPLGIVWTRVWGMENSLYALVLFATVLFYHRRFREPGTPGRAAWLGALLGVLTLTRLNSGFLIPVLLGTYLFFSGRHGSFRARFHLCWVIGGVASAIVLPYLGYNVATTGHLLPVAGGAKRIRAELFLADEGVESVWSTEFVRVLERWSRDAREWFVTSRAMDGTWIAGGRLVLHESTTYAVLLSVLAGLFLAPFLVGRPREWLADLRRQLGRLAPFTYVALFAALNAVVSLVMFPYEATYSIKRWWLLEAEVVLATCVAVLAGSSLAFLGSHWIAQRHRLRLATWGLVILVVLSIRLMVAFYWDGEVQYPDWNRSTNDARYAAGIWLRDNVPDDAVVGSWNAGVLGYYTDCHVVNLDGLINSWDFLPYLAARDIAGYCVDQGIEYLADTQYELVLRGGAGLLDDLNCTTVYDVSMDPLDTGLAPRQQDMWVLRTDLSERGRRQRARSGGAGSADPGR